MTGTSDKKANRLNPCYQEQFISVILYVNYNKSSIQFFVYLRADSTAVAYYYYYYYAAAAAILRRDSIKDLGVHIDCKLHFHHADFLYSYAMKLLGLIRTLTFSFSTTRRSTDAVLCFGQT
jgi:hypothetical protein